MDVEALLEGLDPEQLSAVTSDAAPLAVIAPAGSGKTRVLVARIAHRIATGRADADHVLALTFTRKAAGELTARLAAHDIREQVTAGTFHAVALGSLQRYWDDRRLRPRALLDRPETVISDLRGLERMRPADIASDIAWAQARLVPPDRFEAEVRAAGRRTAARPAQVAELYRAYEAAKRAKRLIDFGDLLMVLTTMLQDDRTLAEVERWRFRHLFVDEFQDLNAAQLALLEAWRGGRPDLFAVGDPNQSIYGWNGSDPAFLSTFTAHYSGATVMRLVTNYRTPAEILGPAATVLGDRAEPAVASREGGRAPTLVRFADEPAEAAGLIELVRYAAAGRTWSTVAVLARTHSLLEQTSEALAGAGIPVRLRRDLSMPAEVRRWWVQRRAVPLRDALDELWNATVELDGEPGEPDPMAVRVAAASGELAGAFAASHPGTSVTSFLPWLSAAGGAEDSGDAVELATFHAAKGLEWPSVVIIGAEDGTVPLGSSSTSNTDEERRLLYVAMTRARRELVVTWTAQRSGQARKPSPWIGHLAAPETTPAPGPPAEVRALARRTPAADTGDTLARLRRWRSETARAGRADPRAVLGDEALEALTSARTRQQIAETIGAVKAARYGDAISAVLRVGAIGLEPVAGRDAV